MSLMRGVVAGLAVSLALVLQVSVFPHLAWQRSGFGGATGPMLDSPAGDKGCPPELFRV